MTGAERRALRAEIEAHGFEPDPLVLADTPTWGLNLACGWPLPVEVGAYRAIANELTALDPALCVYPHGQTHITLLTLVSFKDHLAPGPAQQRALEDLIPLVNELVAPLASQLAPFTLEIGAPVLSRRAAFFPIADPAGAIARFRAAVLPALIARAPAFASCRPPPAVHSTLARFRAAPAPGFLARFEAWAPSRALGPAPISSILVTTETRPYMRGGTVAGAFPL